MLLFLLQVVIPQKNGRKVTTVPGNKVGGKKSLAPMFAEKLISPHRKGASWAKLPQDKRNAKLGEREKRKEKDEGRNYKLDQDEEGKKSSSADAPSWWLKDTKGQPCVSFASLLEGLCENTTLQKAALAIPGWFFRLGFIDEASQWTFDLCCPIRVFALKIRH